MEDSDDGGEGNDVDVDEGDKGKSYVDGNNNVTKNNDSTIGEQGVTRKESSS